MENKKGSFVPIFIVLIASLLIASFWDKLLVIKHSVHAVLDPSAGALLNWNVTYGMILLTLIITLITTLFQKYTTDQETLRELKKEQKLLQEEMKKYKDHPEKLIELQKKQFEFIPKTFQLTMRPLLFTGVPVFLFIRWFMDYFSAIPEFRFFGFLTWLWFYIICSIIFSVILRKVLKVE